MDGLAVCLWVGVRCNVWVVVRVKLSGRIAGCQPIIDMTTPDAVYVFRNSHITPDRRPVKSGCTKRRQARPKIGGGSTSQRIDRAS